MTTVNPAFAPFMPLPPESFVRRAAEPLPFIGGVEFFSAGRGALFRVLDLHGAQNAVRVFLPRFFCPQITRLVAMKAQVVFFEDLPSEDAPRFETLAPKSGDIVVAVNFFGSRRRAVWDAWAKPEGVVLVEDHSHAPFSEWAQGSCADYAFASLRKWLPLPDGAWLKCKTRAPSLMFSRGAGTDAFAAAALSLAAITTCRADAEASAQAVRLFYDAEAKLNAKAAFSRMSEYSGAMLPYLDIAKISAVRAANFAAFANALNGVRGVRIMNAASLSENASVYCPALKFESNILRDCAYNALRKNGVFASIYWGGLGENASVDAREESDTTFVVPLDFRHSASDAAWLAEIISRACGGCK